MEIAMANMLLDGLVAHLVTELEEKPEDLKIQTLRAGRLQQDPTQSGGLNLLIYPPGLDKEEDITIDKDDDRMEAPAHLLDGSMHMYRPFKFSLMFHFRGERDRLVAQEKAMVLQARVRRALINFQDHYPTHPITGRVTDDFGETLIMQEMREGIMREAGGPGHFIWKGEMYMTFLTFIQRSIS